MSTTKPNEVVVEYDEGSNESGAQAGSITGYKCDYHVQSGAINDENGVVVSSYYDLLYPCDKNADDLVDAVAPAVLAHVAEHFNLLPDGTVCTIPNTSLPLWVIGVSSLPVDTLVPNLECQKLSSNGNSSMCCDVVHAPMTLWWTNRDFRMSDILGVLSSEFNSPKATVSLGSASGLVTVQYVGAFMDTSAESSRGNLPPAISASDTPTSQQAATGPRQFTIIGGLVLAALTVALLVAFFLVHRQRRRRKHQSKIQDAHAKSEDTHSDGPTLEVDVMSDACDIPPQIPHPFPSSFEDDMANTPSSYTFDLASSMKLHVLGTYSDLPTSMAVVPPYPMEETSDSEVDSWAQTDGTVGSLEDRLEEITAEI